MKNAIVGYLTYLGFQTLSREFFRGVIRANPKRHAQYIAYMNYRIDLEMDLYDRMHQKTPKVDEPEPESETADPR